MEVVMPLLKAGVGRSQQRGLEGLSPFRRSLQSSHPDATPDPFLQIEPSICQARKSTVQIFAPYNVCESIPIQELVKRSSSNLAIVERLHKSLAACGCETEVVN